MILNYGKWKIEKKFERGKFLRSKCYIEEVRCKKHFTSKKLNIKRKNKKYYIKNFNGLNKEIQITCAGLPEKCYKHVTWNNFETGFTVKDKLTFKHVKGGVKLVETEFTIKP